MAKNRKKNKYKLGDIVNYFEGEIWVYGLNQPLNTKSPSCVEYGLEFENQDDFDLHYEIVYSGYYRCGNPCQEIKDDGYRYQFYEAMKGKGAMPITSWEFVR